MRYAREVILGLLFLGLLLIVAAIGAWLGRSFWPRPLERLWSTATIVRQVQGLSQLVTVKYVLEKVVILEDVKWYGESRVLLVAHGIAKAGVDLGQLRQEDLSVQGRRIRVQVPPVMITDVYLDEHKTQVVERSTGLLRLFDKDLEQNARRQAIDDIRRAARSSGILDDAEERVRLQLQHLFGQMGFEEVELVMP